jgi:ribosomal protein L12E/L44/L45/RPP1/RPP2
MKYLAAYLLLVVGGTTRPSASDIRQVLESVGIEADASRLGKLLDELRDEDVNKVQYKQEPHCRWSFRQADMSKSSSRQVQRS